VKNGLTKWIRKKEIGVAKIIDLKEKRIEKELESIRDELMSADSVIDDILDEIDEVLVAYGFTNRDKDFAKNFYYVMESLRSLIFSYHQIHHPFQDIVGDMVEAKWNEKYQVWSVGWKKDLKKQKDKKKLDLEDDIE